MVSIDELKQKLQNRLSSKRYIHSIGVYKTAIKLANIYNVSQKKAAIAGLLHDYAKDISELEARNYIAKYNIKIDEVIERQIDLAHGYIGAELIREDLEIFDEEILQSIRYHTTGKADMTRLEKIIYLSDYIEPNRSFPKIDELRNVALSNLDKATLMALNNTIYYVINKGDLIHPDSIIARNSLLIKAQVNNK